MTEGQNEERSCWYCKHYRVTADLGEFEYDCEIQSEHFIERLDEEKAYNMPCFVPESD